MVRALERRTAARHTVPSVNVTLFIVLAAVFREICKRTLARYSNAHTHVFVHSPTPTGGQSISVCKSAQKRIARKIVAGDDWVKVEM